MTLSDMHHIEGVAPGAALNKLQLFCFFPSGVGNLKDKFALRVNASSCCTPSYLGVFMTVIVARTSTPEGEAALAAALEEARRRQEDLVVFNLEGTQLDPEGSELQGVPVTYRMPDARDRDAVGDFLDAAEEVGASAVVIGVRHRSKVGKFLLGSAAQQILLEANAPVIAVKAPQS